MSDGDGAEENSIIPKLTKAARMSFLNFSGEQIQQVFFHFHNATPRGKFIVGKKADESRFQLFLLITG